jgi:hypothetical protein
MSTDPETRRAIAQRAIDRAAARERYLNILALRKAERESLRKSRLGIGSSESSAEANEE